MKKLVLAVLAAAVTVPTVAPTVVAQGNGYYRDRDGHSYRGRNGRYRYRCKRSSGTTGLVAGGVGGALIGNALGGGTLGTLAGAGGGALLGRHLDKKHDSAQNRRNGC